MNTDSMMEELEKLMPVMENNESDAMLASAVVLMRACAELRELEVDVPAGSPTSSSLLQMEAARCVRRGLQLKMDAIAHLC